MEKGSRNHQNSPRVQAKDFPNKSKLTKSIMQAYLASKGATLLSQETQSCLASKDGSKTLGLS